MPNQRDIDALLSAPASPDVGRALIDWVTHLRGRIGRGDMAIGILSPAEVEKAPRALQRAADCGLPSALIELGTWFAAPPYGEPDLAAADAVLRRAVDSHVEGAVLQLGRIRWFLRSEDASPDEQLETFALLRAAVDANPADAEALHLLGLLTCHGFGTDAAPHAAVEMQQKAASLGSTDAMFELYIHYQTGLGVAPDEYAAFEANRVAAEAGHPRALYNMGACFATGHHVPRDMAEAAAWYARASDAGNANATATLALMYATGEGVAKDADYATELFDLADHLGFNTTELRQSVDL